MKNPSSSICGSDLLVILKMALWHGQDWDIEHLSAELDMPLSEIYSSIERGQKFKLIHNDQTVALEELKDFLLYCVQYLFPAELGEMGKGMATGPKPGLFSGPGLPYFGPWIWPYENGKANGAKLLPLAPQCFFAALNDPKLHLLLSVTDTLRVLGKVARPWATFEISRILRSN